MDTDIQIYRDLQKHLDRLPIRLPATESGVEIRILKHLFTPEEAKIASQLSLIPEPVKRIHRRLKKSGLSKSKWISDLIKQKTAGTWPESIVELAGAWKDLPTAEEIRKDLGVDVERESL